MTGITKLTDSSQAISRPGYLGGITPRNSEGRKIIPKRADQLTYIPLTPSDEANSTTKFFVKPGTELTVKSPVTGEYKSSGEFDYRWKFSYSHYVVQGKFTNSSGQEQETELIIPRKVIEERFHFA